MSTYVVFSKKSHSLVREALGPIAFVVANAEGRQVFVEDVGTVAWRVHPAFHHGFRRRIAHGDVFSSPAVVDAGSGHAVERREAVRVDMVKELALGHVLAMGSSHVGQRVAPGEWGEARLDAFLIGEGEHVAGKVLGLVDHNLVGLYAHRLCGVVPVHVGVEAFTDGAHRRQDAAIEDGRRHIEDDGFTVAPHHMVVDGERQSVIAAHRDHLPRGVVPGDFGVEGFGQGAHRHEDAVAGDDRRLVELDGLSIHFQAHGGVGWLSEAKAQGQQQASKQESPFFLHEDHFFAIVYRARLRCSSTMFHNTKTAFPVGNAGQQGTL